MAPYLAYARDDGTVRRLDSNAQVGTFGQSLRFDPLGETLPQPGVNVGVLSGVTRTTHTGDLVLDTSRSNTTIQNLDVTGRILWNGSSAGSNITLRNIKVMGGPSGKSAANGDTGNVPLIQCWTTTGTNLVMEDIEIAPSHPDVYTYGVHGHGYTIRRFDIHDCTDGFVTYTDRGSLREGGIVRDVRWWANDPNQTDGAHNDPHQAQGGTGHKSVGVYYDSGPLTDATRTDGDAGAAGFSVLGTQDSSVHTNFELDHCWIAGTTRWSPIQMGDSGRGAWVNPKITNCRFLGNFGSGGHGWVRCSDLTKAALTFTGNTGPSGQALTINDVVGTTTLR